jgi:hypothetical protein
MKVLAGLTLAVLIVGAAWIHIARQSVANAAQYYMTQGN